MSVTQFWSALLVRVIGSGMGMGPKLLNGTSLWKLFLLGRKGLYFHCISMEMLAAILPPIGAKGECADMSQQSKR